MENYVFVCIGTNELIEDSFGPRVGDILKKNFYKNTNVKVLGTMKSPIHFQNAPIFLDYLEHKRSNLIVVDSALGEEENVGNTYLNLGGIEIGKAFGKSIYFPACLNVKTIVGTNKTFKKDFYTKEMNLQFKQIQRIRKINQLAQKVAAQIVESISEMI